MVPLVIAVGLALAVLAVRIGFWRIVAGAALERAGWPELARRYPASGRPEDRPFARQSGVFHGVARAGTLRVMPCARGLRVEMERAFSSGAPALVIPWSAFQELREYRSVFGARHYELVLSEEESPRLRRSAGDAVRQYLQERHRIIRGRTLWPFAGAPARQVVGHGRPAPRPRCGRVGRSWRPARVAPAAAGRWSSGGGFRAGAGPPVVSPPAVPADLRGSRRDPGGAAAH